MGAKQPVDPNIIEVVGDIHISKRLDICQLSHYDRSDMATLCLEGELGSGQNAVVGNVIQHAVKIGGAVMVGSVQVHQKNVAFNIFQGALFDVLLQISDLLTLFTSLHATTPEEFIDSSSDEDDEDQEHITEIPLFYPSFSQTQSFSTREAEVQEQVYYFLLLTTTAI